MGHLETLPCKSVFNNFGIHNKRKKLYYAEEDIQPASEHPCPFFPTLAKKELCIY